MATAGPTNTERTSELLTVGHQCSHSTCLLVDFLPFNCQHCAQPFCGEHFLPQAHQCERYDESKFDRVAPTCPLCNEPVAIPPGQDPNLRMERHISSECSVMTGKTKKSSSPHCAQPKCGKLLFAPIQCTTCKQQYCPSHRFPKDHTCIAPSVSGGKASAGGKPKQSAAAGAAALAAFRRAAKPSSPVKPSAVTANKPAKTPAPVQKATPPSAPPASAASSASNKKPGSSPFSKTDRRAKAERESKLKAMQARAQKGLLSEEEKALLAAEEKAAAARKNECVIG